MADAIRTSSLATHTRAVSDMGRLQADLAKIQQQISSTRKASTFGELGNDTNRVLDLEASITQVKRFQSNNNVVSNRLAVMRQAVTEVQNIASQFRQQVIIERSNGNVQDLSAFARSALSQIEGALRVEDNGRYVFSGGKTDRPPIADGQLQNSSLIGGVPTDNYYQGDSLIFTQRAGEQTELEYGVTANDPAFVKLIGAINLAIEGEAEGAGADGFYRQSLDLIAEVVEAELPRVGYAIDSNKLRLQTINDEHSKVEVQLKSFLDDVAATDVVGASIDLSLTESVLTASMQTFARISRLTLSDYLR